MQGSLGDLALNTPEVRSYFAGMEVFGELLTGFFSRDWIGMYTYINEVRPFVVEDTRVFETDLAFTEELFPTYASCSGTSTAPKRLRPLQIVIKELFQNMTLALLGVPELLAPQAGERDIGTSAQHAQHLPLRYVATLVSIMEQHSAQLCSP